MVNPIARNGTGRTAPVITITSRPAGLRCRNRSPITPPTVTPRNPDSAPTPPKINPAVAGSTPSTRIAYGAAQKLAA